MWYTIWVPFQSYSNKSFVLIHYLCLETIVRIGFGLCLEMSVWVETPKTVNNLDNYSSISQWKKLWLCRKGYTLQND